MMIERIWFLDTTPDRFLDRIFAYARESGWTAVPFSDGIYVYPGDYEQARAYGPIAEPAVQRWLGFVVHDLAPSRIQALGKCPDPAHGECFEKLCERIDEWWALDQSQRPGGATETGSLKADEQRRRSPEQIEQEVFGTIPSRYRRKRREQVLLLGKAGRTVDEICDSGSWAKRTVERDLEWLRKHNLLPSGSERRQMA